MIGVIVVCLLEVGYCMKFKEKYGIFSPSSVSTINQSWMAFQDGLMDSSYTDNPIFKDYIVTHNNTEFYTPEMIKKFGVVTVQEAVNKSRHSRPTDWLLHTYLRYREASSAPLFAAATWCGIITEFIGFSIRALHLFLIIYIIFLFWKMKQCNEIYRASLIMLITSIGNLMLIVIGAQGEWGRLLLPSLPLFIIMFGQAFNYIKFDFNGTTKETDIE